MKVTACEFCLSHELCIRVAWSEENMSKMRRRENNRVLRFNRMTLTKIWVQHFEAMTVVVPRTTNKATLPTVCSCSLCVVCLGIPNGQPPKCPKGSVWLWFPFEPSPKEGYLYKRHTLMPFTQEAEDDLRAAAAAWCANCRWCCQHATGPSSFFNEGTAAHCYFNKKHRIPRFNQQISWLLVLCFFWIRSLACIQRGLTLGFLGSGSLWPGLCFGLEVRQEVSQSGA